MSDFTFNTKDIYVGDIIKAEEFVFSNVEKNNNEPYVEGRVIAGGKNNLFVKIANMYKSPISGKVYQALSFLSALMRPPADRSRVCSAVLLSKPAPSMPPP